MKQVHARNTRMIKTSFYVLFFILVFYYGTHSALAKTVVRTGDAISVAEDQVIEGDFYSAAGTVNVSGSVNGDSLLVGGQVNLNGTVTDDVFVVGGSVDVAGSIGDDVRVIAGEVTISEPIQGDVFVFGGVVNILSTASVSGDVVLFAQEVTIEGSVGGNILGAIDTLRIDAPVAGDVDITVAELTLGNKADIEGSVRYVSTQLVNQALNATIAGDVVRSDPPLPVRDVNVRATLIPVLILLFAVLGWYLLSRNSLKRVVGRACTLSPRPLLLGFGTIIFAPIAIIVLFASMIGTLAALVAFFGYALILVLSLIAISAVIGQLMMRLFNQPSTTINLMSILVGVVGVGLLMLLPIIGPIVLLGFMVITLGAIVDLLLRPQLK